MRKVFIVVDSGVKSAVVEAMKTAIAACSPDVEALVYLGSELDFNLVEPDILLCPLTRNLPTNLEFSGKEIYRFCQDILGTRQRVEKEFGILTGEGNLWLPVVWTARGPLYAEVIGLGENSEDKDSFNYCQPVHLPDVKRQQVYGFSYRFLTSLDAIPGCYLMQFGFRDDQFYFDQLWPFPGESAIASLGIQTPDLFICHWQCLTNSPIYDISINSCL